MSILEDLTILSPRKLEKRLQQLAKDALPCIEIWSAGADRAGGLTVAIHVDARSRRDVQDLGRVIEDDPRGLLSSAWSLLPPSKRSSAHELLLRVDLERPVRCEFAIRLPVSDHRDDPIRQRLPLLLAASWFTLVTDQHAGAEDPQLCFAAPPARECLLQLLAQ